MGENIFAYAQNVNRPTVQDYVNYYHAGFLIDWGNLDFGHLAGHVAPLVSRTPRGSPPAWISLPRNQVARTTPASGRPAYGVMAFLWCSRAASTTDASSGAKSTKA